MRGWVASIAVVKKRAVLVQVTIGSEDLKANHMIQQIFEFPQEFEKYNLLVRRHTIQKRDPAYAS